MRDAVIIDAVRTPLGKRNGTLAGVHPADLSASVLNALVTRNSVGPSTVDDVLWGCVTQSADQASNVGRNAVLAAGWPEAIPAATVNRACGSSQQAVSFAAAGVIAGHYDLAIAGGVESMSRVRIGSAADGGQPVPPHVLERYGVTGFSQGIGAELIAEKWGMSRRTLDEFALRSHELAIAAADSGALDGQLVPVAGLAADEGVRRGGTLEKLAALKPAFKENGLIHAGNSSQISDGAGALLITSSDYALANGMKPVARIHTSVVIGDDPVMMLTGPIPATAKALRKSGLSIGEIGAFEVNEAFAPIPLAWLAETGADPGRLNPLGGAIAVGHPLGGSGAILMTRLVHHMRDSQVRYGLQTMCEGGGMANATILELL
jgi:acetyl-CoA acyltransferase